MGEGKGTRVLLAFVGKLQVSSEVLSQPRMLPKTLVTMHPG